MFLLFHNNALNKLIKQHRPNDKTFSIIKCNFMCKNEPKQHYELANIKFSWLIFHKLFNFIKKSKHNDGKLHSTLKRLRFLIGFPRIYCFCYVWLAVRTVVRVEHMCLPRALKLQYTSSGILGGAGGKT